MPSRTYCWTKLIPGFFLSHHHISAVSKLKRRISYYIWSNRCVPQCARQALLSKSPRAIIFRIIAFHTDYGVCYLEHLGARWWSSLVAIFSDQAYPFSVLATVFMLACGKRNKLTRKNNTGFFVSFCEEFINLWYIYMLIYIDLTYLPNFWLIFLKQFSFLYQICLISLIRQVWFVNLNCPCSLEENWSALILCTKMSNLNFGRWRFSYLIIIKYTNLECYAIL